MAYSTLYDYYQGKLPSLQERAKTYSSYGFTDPYSGTATQNTALLGKLQTPTQSTFLQPAGTSNIGPTITNPFGGQLSGTTTQPKTTTLFQPSSTTPNYTGFVSNNDPRTQPGYVAPGATEPPKLPEKPTEPTADDFRAYFEGLSGKAAVDTAKSEYDAARTASDTAFSQGQTQIQGLIEGSQKLFNDLFNSPELSQAKDAQARAFKELSNLDAEEAKEVNALKEKVRSQGVVGWAARGQLGIIAEGFNAQKAGYLAQEAIANNAIEKGYKYAEQAYNANLATLNAKIQLVQNVIDRAKTLSDDEKAEFSDVLKRAEELYKTKKEGKDEAITTYVELLKLGVKNINPNMSREEMLRAAGPTVAQQAADAIDQEKRLKEAQINAQKAATYKSYQDANGTDTKDLTVDQSKARGFAVNAENANNILNTSTYKPGIFSFSLPNRLQTEERQSFEQGARAFVNSVLRRESGATITDSEFNNKYKELIPVAGDSQAVIEQKVQARAAAVQSLNESGLRTTDNQGGMITVAPDGTQVIITD